jgi:hypothetical protein
MTTPSPRRLDWSGRNGASLATVGPLARCRHCGTLTLLRHPVTGEPCHKTCEELAFSKADSAAADRPERTLT